MLIRWWVWCLDKLKGLVHAVSLQDAKVKAGQAHEGCKAEEDVEVYRHTDDFGPRPGSKP